MRLTYRLSLSLTFAVATVSLAFAYYQTRIETKGLNRALERHATVLAESLAKSVEPLLENGSFRELQRLVARFQERQQLAGVGVYNRQAKPVTASEVLTAKVPALPPAITEAMDTGTAKSEFVHYATPMHVTALPLHSASGAIVGALAIFHDTSYISYQAWQLWKRAFIGVFLQTLLIVGITLLMLRWAIRQPLLHMTKWMRELRAGAPTSAPALGDHADLAPLTTEVTRLASSLTAARAAAEEEARLRVSAESSWTEDRLRVFVNRSLKGSRLFVLSNREPYEHFRQSGRIECATPASGLVTALEPILRTCDGTWIAQASGDADHEVVDHWNHVRVPPEHPQYTLRRIWLTEEEQQGFYLGFANEGLWPLCHIAHTRPTFRAADWAQYQAVNQKFADVLLEEVADEADPVVLVQDYHFALVPRMIKEKRPDARVAIFWHIPWPNPEAFGICPWQKPLLEGLLGADLVSFHIQAHCNNFLDTVDRQLESRIERERFAVSRESHHTLVRAFPISVAPVASNGKDRVPNTSLELSALFAKLGVEATFLGVGVDRVDYTKGIPERFQAIERFLEKWPVYRRKFTFVQIGSPSRSEIKRYHDLMEEVRQEADRINQRFQTGNWRPIILLNHRHSHEEIQPFYRAADLCLVTSLHDGMNLVAKEFVSARADGQGALILSRFAGAAHELADALIVNPYDIDEIADAIHRALEMSPEERRIRMQRMRATVRERNVYRWAGDLIGELCEIRPASSSVAESKAVVGPRLLRSA